eukprot:gnl/TRDRNA2_/TRDRNA2_146578_c0_seq1.p1 gnl/TRDRNA2_/TRDRNA2_146578_c0~~gnl/TRDRNA2_/TRDRNA2_146578_c0_seq1.p1  ORF type:complete len:205 (+),score=23.62 gnl/TRDRNA2_/TRDRNA2_146578_c0_seq1:131-745(+)
MAYLRTPRAFVTRIESAYPVPIPSTRINDTTTPTGGYVRACYAAIEGRVIEVHEAISALRVSVYERASHVIDTTNRTVVRLHKTGLIFCEEAEALIDRWLPEPQMKSDEKCDELEGKPSVILRTIALPFRVPVRSIHIVAYRANSMIEHVFVNTQWMIELTQDQKRKLAESMVQRIRRVASKFAKVKVALTLKDRTSESTRDQS